MDRPLFSPPTNNLKTTVKLAALAVVVRNLIAVINQERPGNTKTTALRRAVRETEKALIRAEERS